MGEERRGLERGSYYERTHMGRRGDGESAYKCWGKILTLKISLTIDHKRTWVTIGEYCKRCGEVAIFPEFVKGVPDMSKLKKILEERRANRPI